MRLTVDRSALAAHLATLARVAPRSPTMPILANVKVEATADGVRLSATDLHLSATATAPADIEAPGDCTVDARNLLSIWRALPAGPVTLSSEDGRTLTVQGSGGQAFKMAGIVAQDFPRLPADPAEWHPIDGPALVGAFRAVAPSIGRDDRRLALTGAALESDGSRLTVLATDGTRLARESREMGAALPVLRREILPGDAVRQIVRTWQKAPPALEMGHDGEHLHFRGAGLTLAAKVIEAQFPPVEVAEEKAAAGNLAEVRTDAAELAGALHRAQLVAENLDCRTVNLFAGPGVLRVSGGEFPYTVPQIWHVPRKTRTACVKGQWQSIDEGPDEKNAHWQDCTDGEYQAAPPAGRRLDWRGEFIATDIDAAYQGAPRAVAIDPVKLMGLIGKKPSGPIVLALPEDSRDAIRVEFAGRRCVLMPCKLLGHGDGDDWAPAWPVHIAPPPIVAAAPIPEVLPSPKEEVRAMPRKPPSAPPPPPPKKAPAPTCATCGDLRTITHRDKAAPGVISRIDCPDCTATIPEAPLVPRIPTFEAEDTIPEAPRFPALSLVVSRPAPETSAPPARKAPEAPQTAAPAPVATSTAPAGARWNESEIGAYAGRVIDEIRGLGLTPKDRDRRIAEWRRWLRPKFLWRCDCGTDHYTVQCPEGCPLDMGEPDGVQTLPGGHLVWPDGTFCSADRGSVNWRTILAGVRDRLVLAPAEAAPPRRRKGKAAPQTATERAAGRGLHLVH